MFIRKYTKPSTGVTVSSHNRKALFGGKRAAVKYQQHGQPLSDEQLSRLVDALQEQQKQDAEPTA
jgi:hypothetical protein